jgi:hypothetical protein
MKTVILTKSQSAAGTIRRLFPKNSPNSRTRVLASCDEYSHGPLSTVGTSSDFFVARTNFWRSLDIYDADIRSDIDLRVDHSLMVNEVKSADKVELWLANSLQDFFDAVVTLHLLKSDGVDTSELLLRDFSGPKTKWGLGWGLGVLSVEDLELLRNSISATPFDHKIYDDAWLAISKGSTAAMKRFIDDNDPSLPMVTAFSSLLLRYPEFNRNLGSFDRALLGAGTEEMKKSSYTVGNAMVRGMPETDQVGELPLFARLIDLGKAKPDPWFKLEGDLRISHRCSAQITDSGKEARARFSVQIL